MASASCALAAACAAAPRVVAAYDCKANKKLIIHEEMVEGLVELLTDIIDLSSTSERNRKNCYPNYSG